MCDFVVRLALHWFHRADEVHLFRREAEALAKNEPVLAPFVRAAVLDQGDYISSLAAVLDGRLSDAAGEQWGDPQGFREGSGGALLLGALAGIQALAMADLMAVLTRVRNGRWLSHNLLARSRWCSDPWLDKS